MAPNEEESYYTTSKHPNSVPDLTLDDVFSSTNKQNKEIKSYDTKLFITRESENGIMPTKSYDSSAGWDLYAAKSVVIKPGEYQLIPIDLFITIAEGYWYSVKPRSSLGFKKDIYPSFESVFDAQWTGNMDIKVWNLSDKIYCINKGDKFAQLVVHKVYDVELVELSLEQLEQMKANLERGDKGWGSSGR